MGRWGGETGSCSVVQRGSGDGGMGTGGPTFTCGGKKSGRIPWEPVIPAPGQTT